MQLDFRAYRRQFVIENMSKRTFYFPDWIQTIVVVAALGIAVSELYLKSDAPRLEKAKNTVELLREGYDPNVLASLDAFTSGPKAMYEKTAGNFGDALIILTPFHEYLVAFAVCYDTGLCLEEETLDYLCTRLTAYENSIPSIYATFGVPMPDGRTLKETQAWSDCAAKQTSR